MFKCREKASGIDYAVKVSECYNNRAVEEVRKHEALSKHPNCVQFVKAWEEGYVEYIMIILSSITINSHILHIVG